MAEVCVRHEVFGNGVSNNVTGICHVTEVTTPH